jgi:hypothetical protein
MCIGTMAPDGRSWGCGITYDTSHLRGISRRILVYRPLDTLPTFYDWPDCQEHRMVKSMVDGWHHYVRVPHMDLWWPPIGRALMRPFMA